MQIMAYAAVTILLTMQLMTATAFAQDAAVLSHFDCDRTAPLGLNEAGVERRGGISIQNISYTSPNDSRSTTRPMP
jgi:hypothetical protein